MTNALLVMLGAALGGGARYWMGSVLLARYSSRFPFGTVVVNLTGCLLIGAVMGVLMQRGDPHPAWRLFIVTGILGGYTTFSAFAWESVQAFSSERPALGLVNILVSVIGGCLAVWLGITIARLWR